MHLHLGLCLHLDLHLHQHWNCMWTCTWTCTCTCTWNCMCYAGKCTCILYCMWTCTCTWAYTCADDDGDDDDALRSPMTTLPVHMRRLVSVIAIANRHRHRHSSSSSSSTSSSSSISSSSSASSSSKPDEPASNPKADDAHDVRRSRQWVKFVASGRARQMACARRPCPPRLTPSSASTAAPTC